MHIKEHRKLSVTGRYQLGPILHNWRLSSPKLVRLCKYFSCGVTREHRNIEKRRKKAYNDISKSVLVGDIRWVGRCLVFACLLWDRKQYGSCLITDYFVLKLLCCFVLNRQWYNRIFVHYWSVLSRFIVWSKFGELPHFWLNEQRAAALPFSICPLYCLYLW